MKTVIELLSIALPVATATILAVISLINLIVRYRNLYRDCLILKKRLGTLSQKKMAAIDDLFIYGDELPIKATEELIKFGHGKYFLAKWDPNSKRWEVHKM